MPPIPPARRRAVTTASRAAHPGDPAAEATISTTSTTAPPDTPADPLLTEPLHAAIHHASAAGAAMSAAHPDHPMPATPTRAVTTPTAGEAATPSSERFARGMRRMQAFAAIRPVRWLMALALVCAWLLPGTLGHDPWKQDETYTFGIVQHMLDTGDLVVPTNAGQPFVEKPPIYDWVATGFAWLLGRYLPLHDAARLASALFAALTLYYTARVARGAIAAGPSTRGVDPPRWFDLRVIGTLALFAGTLVVVKHVHDMMTDVALMAGAALGFCGLFELVLAHWRDDARTPAADDRAPDRHAALRFGAGVGVSLLAKGLFVPLVFGATTAAVLLLYPACRSRRFGRALGVAALACAPFALIWPICFYLRSEALFKVWLWDNNVGRFFGFSVPELGSENDGRLFVLRTVLSVGFPVVPMALAALFGAAFSRSSAATTARVALSTGEIWRRWREPRVALPALFGGIGFAVLQTSATVRELYILPFIGPLALLAMHGVERLPGRVHVVWDMTSRVLFGSVAALAWIVWSIMSGPVDTHASLHRLGRWLPLDWVMPAKPVLIVAALMLTIGWVWLLPAFKYAGKWRGVLSWSAGAIVAWGLVSTLLLPWLDEAKSYRSVFEDLGARLGPAWNDGDCMVSEGLGESEAPMLYYFTGIEHRPSLTPDESECTWLIDESRRGRPRVQSDEWRLFWVGARPGDGDELFRVFLRVPRGEGF